MRAGRFKLSIGRGQQGAQKSGWLSTIRGRLYLAFGLAAALYGEIDVRAGRVVQGNFDDYRMPRMAEMPKVETVLVPSGDFWGGVGEPPPVVVAPAVCNAIFAATGKRIRSLPLKNHELRKI